MKNKINKTKKLSRKIKRNIKDSVFTDLFRIPKYRLELYRTFHPNDKTVTENDIKTLTLLPVLTNGLYNDLGMLVGDSIIFLLEAQSIWSINIVIREFLYLSDTYKKLLDNENLYGTKKIKLPIPELYVLYTGNEKITKKEISLNNEFFDGKAPIDLKVKVIVDSKKNSILKQYIDFCKLSDSKTKTKGHSTKVLKEIINECKKKNILKEYLIEHEEEVMSIMTMLYDQDVVTRNYENAMIKEAHENGMIDAYISLIKDGLINIKAAAKKMGISEKEFKSRMNVTS